MNFRRALMAFALLVACAVLFILVLLGVNSPALHVAGYERQIAESSRAIEKARTDASRAESHLQRGRAYAEIVRYRHVMRSIGADDYVRLYRLAMLDLDQAVQLEPDNIGMLMARGMVHFEHSWTASENGFATADAARIWLARARADFTAAIDRGASDRDAFDYRGMVSERQGDYPAAIDDYTRVAAIDATLGAIRLADLYCQRGSALAAQKAYANAVSDLEKSIALGANRDGCDCDPYSPLLWTYLEGLGDIDRSWALVHKAQNDRHWLMPELVKKLKAASPRKG